MKAGGPALKGRRLLNAVKSMAQTDHTPTLEKPKCKAAHSRKEYEKTLAWAKKLGYQSMYNAMAGDGFDASVDWAALREEKPSDNSTT